MHDKTTREESNIFEHWSYVLGYKIIYIIYVCKRQIVIESYVVFSLIRVVYLRTPPNVGHERHLQVFGKIKSIISTNHLVGAEEEGCELDTYTRYGRLGKCQTRKVTAF